jgi:hypothetical protein
MRPVTDANAPRHDWIERVWLTLSRPVELAPGVLLPAGTYSGKSKRSGALSEPRSSKVEYVLEFSAAALRNMGAEPPPAGAHLKEYDVTDFVAFGQMVVA